MDKYAVIGYPLGHTFSPQIHNPAFKALDINAVYDVCQIAPDRFDNEIKNLKKGIYRGFNVTVPYKQRIIPFIDTIDPIAAKVNAVNTVKKAGDKWHGFNTDLYGFLQPIRDYTDHIKNVLVIGAGGAANAVCFALLENAAVQSLTIANRTLANAQILKERLNKSYKVPVQIAQLEKRTEEKFDLIVNSSSVGMGKASDKNPFDINNSFHNDTIVYDLIYNPKETLFLQTARSQKLRVINGLDMLIGQAAKSFSIWTGQPFPMDVIDKKIFYK